MPTSASLIHYAPRRQYGKYAFSTVADKLLIEYCQPLMVLREEIFVGAVYFFDNTRRMVILLIHYARISPEAPFPAALDQREHVRL